MGLDRRSFIAGLRLGLTLGRINSQISPASTYDEEDPDYTLNYLITEDGNILNTEEDYLVFEG